MRSIAEELRESGIPEKDILFLNLDTKKYLSVTTPQKLAAVIDSLKTDADYKYLFIDEIQNIRNFEPLINAYREDGDISIFITGSNSYLLSGELVTKLTGRYIELTMFPLTFAEFVGMKRFWNLEVANDLRLEFESYITDGGFPKTLEFPDADARQNYVRNVVEQILEKDVRQRAVIRNTDVFGKVMTYMIANFGATTNIRHIADYLRKSEGITVKTETLRRYIQLLCNARILHLCRRFDLKSKKSLRDDGKYYLADLSLYSALSVDRRINYGPVLENILCVYLLSRGYSVSVGRIGKLECDFIIRKGTRYAYIQVAMSVMDPHTEEREFRALEAIRDNRPKYLFTIDPLRKQREGVEHLNLMDFIISGREL